MHIVWDSTWTRNSYSWLEAHPPRAGGIALTETPPETTRDR